MAWLGRSARLPRRTWVWVVLAGALIAAVTRIDVTITNPRVHVRWHPTVTSTDRTARERRYDLRNGQLVEGTATTWRYELGQRSPDNIRALLQDPAVADTAYIDRDALSAEPRRVETRFTIWYPFSDLFDRPSDLLRLHRSVWLLLAGGVLLWTARASSSVRRRNIVVAALLLVGVIAVTFPLDPSFVRMGTDSAHAMNRAEFESWFGGQVRFEKHLSQVVLVQLYQLFEPTDAAPERAVIAMSRGAAAWFVVSAFVIGLLEGWSALVLRYLGLVLLAPAALLYFGWREFGYLSLSVVAFPLLARGLADGGPRLEAAGALAGLGAALHGAGLVSVAGAWLAALGASGRLTERVRRVLRVVAWSTAAYVGWAALYVIVLKLSIIPDPGPADVSPWRPWALDEVRAGRTSAAILSPAGARDIVMAAWVVGAPLLIVALTLWRRYTDEVRMILWYLPPSLLFTIFRWPFDGIGVGMDLVVAGFPAVYALAWVCAHDRKRAQGAAVLLISAHYAFWRLVLDPRFQR